MLQIVRELPVPPEISEGSLAWRVARRALAKGYDVEVSRHRHWQGRGQYTAKKELLINSKRCKLYEQSPRRRLHIKPSCADFCVIESFESERCIYFVVPTDVLKKYGAGVRHITLPKDCVAHSGEQKLLLHYQELWEILF